MNARPDPLARRRHEARRLLGLLALSWLLVLLPWLLVGCADMPEAPSVQTPAPPPALLAACPPLSPEPKRQDVDAIRLRAAEVAALYEACREAALNPEPRRINLEPPGWPQVPPSWGIRAPAASGAQP